MSEPEAVAVTGSIPMAGDLLRLGTVGPKSGRNPKAVPLMMEFEVNPLTGPFLVSSTRGLIWITPQKPQLRAASRLLQVGPFFMDVVREVVSFGEENKWGNVLPMTPEGVLNAVAHLRSYDLTNLEILCRRIADLQGFPVAEGPEGQPFLVGLPLVEADWLEPGMLVVVPQDRDFVGFVLLFGERGVAVVHNASRGIAVCRG